MKFTAQKEHKYLSKYILFFTLFKFLFFIFYFERESTPVKEGQRERERRRQRIPSRLCTANTEPNMALEPTNGEIMT